MSGFYSFPRLDRPNTSSDDINSLKIFSPEDDAFANKKSTKELQSNSKAEKQFWMNDDACKECYRCEKPFSLIRRKHHCRICGRIFCNSCSSYPVKGKPYGYSQGIVRACKACFDISKEKNFDEESDKKDSTKNNAVLQDTKCDLPKAEEKSSSFDAEQTTQRIRLSTNRLLYKKPASKLNLRLVKRSMSVDSLKHACSSTTFASEKFLAFAERLLKRLVSRKLAQLVEKEEVDQNFINAQKNNLQNIITKRTLDICQKVRPRLTLLPTADDESSLSQDSMNITNYIKIICIPGGHLKDSANINGVVYQKNVIHRKMKARIPFPRIMVLESSLEFHRQESRMLSLEMLYEQELQYMKLLVEKITNVGVDVLLLGRGLSRIGQELLLEAGISVSINIDRETLDRVARMTGAKVLPSVDHIVQSLNPTGTCKLWKIEKINISDQYESTDRLVPYMFFEGCKAIMGGTLCLRGGSEANLRYISIVVEDMIKKSYTLILQQKLFADMGVTATSGNEDLLLKMLEKSTIPLWRVRTRGVLQSNLPEKIRYHFYEDSKDQPLGFFLLKRCAGLKEKRGSTLRRHEASSDMQITEGGEEKKTPEESHYAMNFDDTVSYFSIFYILGKERVKVTFENLNVTKENSFRAIRDQLLTLRRKIVAERISDVNSNAQGTSTLGISANFLLCWSSCKLCGKRTKIRPLSRDAAYVSYGKFLQTKLFWTTAYSELEGCDHRLFQDYVSYFEYFGVIGSFEYEENKIYQFSLCGKNNDLAIREAWRNKYAIKRALELELALYNLRKWIKRNVDAYLTSCDDNSLIHNDTESSGFGAALYAFKQSLMDKRTEVMMSISETQEYLAGFLCSASPELFELTRLQRKLLSDLDEWNSAFENLLETMHIPRIRSSEQSIPRLPSSWNVQIPVETSEDPSKCNNLEGELEALSGSLSEPNAATNVENSVANEGKQRLEFKPYEKVEPPQILKSGHVGMLNAKDPYPCLVFDAEPTSLIAYSLGSSVYHSALMEKVQNLNHSSRLFEYMKLPARKSADEIKLTFTCTEANQILQFEIKVFYALQFEALRNPLGESEKIPTGKALSYLMSLSRCSPWGTSGGKTKAKFFRSKDNTLLAKTISVEELDMFHSFAGKYFEHMYLSHVNNKQTAIMKIFGIYTITTTIPEIRQIAEHDIDEGVAGVITGFSPALPIRSESGQENDNQASFRTQKVHFLIMKKLFVRSNVEYDKFDLKGNYRNRYIPNPKPDMVLLDVNFFEIYNGVPLTVEVEDKEMLKEAIEFDTKLFESSGIVDYSLIMGVPRNNQGEDTYDEGSGQIVLGIVDYLQLYNYRKMIESNVKKATMIAGQLEPTVIGPAKYQARFARAMNRYFIPRLEHE